MNNEETIIMQPHNNNKAEELKDTVNNKEEKKQGTGKRAAIVTSAAFGGAAVGGAGAAAAATMLHNENPEEDTTTKPEEEAAPAQNIAQPQAAPAPITEEKEEDVEVTPAVAEEYPDYTNEQNADPVATQTAQQTSSQDDSSDDVQILGVYERTTEDGVHQEAAVLTDGEDVAVILDANGDDMADVLISDANHNDQIDEGEVVDISDYNVSMDTIEQNYYAQQQMEQEQQDTFAYEASNEQDYDNSADVDDIV